MKPNQENIHALVVKLQDYHVGMINRLPGDRHIFSFEQNYIDDQKRPILSLSYKGVTNELVTSGRAYNRSLPPFFSNLLPEGHLRNYLAQRAQVKPEREFFLLAALGADLPGAVTITPFEGAYTDKQIDDHDQDRENYHNETVMRFSLAGLQLKFSAIMETTGGLTVPANGMGGSWIVKLPSTRFPAVPENEFVMLTLAKQIGINLPENRLINVSDIAGLPDDVTRLKEKALAIERFDRRANGQRIHMEDFAQVFGLFPNNKYEKKSYANIAAVLWAETGEDGTFEFVRRLIFSVLIGNADMHLKNWSLIYPDAHTPVIAPGYDFVATLPYIPNDQLALSFGNSRNLNEISLEQVRQFADKARLPLQPIHTIVSETVEHTVAAWKKLDEKDLLPKDIRKIIDKQIQTVALNTQKFF